MQIATQQTFECGAIQTYRDGPQSKTSPYKVNITTPEGVEIDGIYIYAVYFRHTISNTTQTCIDILKSQPFAQGSLDGFRMCITGEGINKCIFNASQMARIATYDVSDHSCDSGVYVVARNS
jgi:hypothetical protein